MTDQEKGQIIQLIKDGKKLPKEYIYKLLAIECKVINLAQSEYTYHPVYLKQEKWEENKNDLKTFKDLCKIFQVI